MLIKYTNYTVHLSGSTVKEVTCEKCRTEYLYAVERTQFGMGGSVQGIGEEGAPDRAAASAASKLELALDDAFELVPCPICGEYQAQMVAFLRNSHLKWMLLLAGLLVISSVISLGVAIYKGNTILAATSAILFLVSIGLIFYRNWSANRYDPNQGDPEPRKQLGRSWAVLRKDLPASTRGS